MAEKTIEDHAHDLRIYAYRTSRTSQDWDKFEEICKSYLKSAVQAGVDQRGDDDGS